MSESLVAAVLERAGRHFGDRLVEPLPAYTITEPRPGLVRAVSGPDAVPAEALAVEGGGNCLVSGFGSSARKPRRLRIRGARNAVFLGAHAGIASADVLVEGDDNLVCFGAFATTGGVTIRIRGSGLSIVIGERCMIATRVVLGRLDPIALYDRTTRRRIDPRGDIVIGEHSWIAREVRIEPGTVIGRETIVGQGATVAGTHPDGAILVGSPARARTTGITWGRMEDLSLDAMEASAEYHSVYVKPREALLARIAALQENLKEHRPATEARPPRPGPFARLRRLLFG